MRAAAILAALLAASAAAAEPAPAPGPAPVHRERLPKPKREITIHLDPIVVYRGVQVDGTMIPRPAPGVPLPTTPPPKCRKDHRGGQHCAFTY